MEISYDTKEIRDVFQFSARAAARYGVRVARALAVRFADLRALPNAAELNIFTPKYQRVQGGPALELDLDDGHVLILVPNHPKRPTNDNVNWALVTRVMVISILKK